MQRTRRARAGVRELWTAVFGEPPVIEADPRLMLDVLVKSLPVETYSVIRRDGVTPPLAQDADGSAEHPERPRNQAAAGPDGGATLEAG